MPQRSRSALRAVVAAAALALVVLGSGCGEAGRTSTTATVTATGSAPRLAPSEPFALSEVAIVGAAGDPLRVPVYVAADPAQRQRGLMDRDHLPEGTGMLFAFPEDTTGGFWMRNTLIPLSIAFLDAEGTALRILHMQPCTTEDCEVYDPGVAYRYAVEVNQGFFSEAGLGEGGRVQLPDDLPAAR